MDAWLIFLIISLVLIGVDLFATSKFLLPVGLAGLVAAVSMIFLPTSMIWLGLLIWGGASVGTVFAFRRWLFKNKRRDDSGTVSDLIGKEVVVIEPIDRAKGTGEIKVYGETWRAFSEMSDHIPVGERVTVLEVSGNRLKVWGKDEALDKGTS